MRTFMEINTVVLGSSFILKMEYDNYLLGKFVSDDYFLAYSLCACGKVDAIA